MWENKILFFVWEEIDKTNDFGEKDEKLAGWLEAHLDELGQEGWEPYSVKVDETETAIFLKRWKVE